MDIERDVVTYPIEDGREAAYAVLLLCCIVPSDAEFERSHFSLPLF